MKRTFALLKRILIGLICVVMIAFACGCENTGEKSDDLSGITADSSFTVELMTVGGMPLEKVGVYVYKSTDKSDLVWAGQTNKDGVVSFTARGDCEYAVSLRDVPNGYGVADYYDIKGKKTVISLETVLAEDSALYENTYKLGSIICDFSVTDTDGNEYKVSELLKEKKAVVLNFWFMSCAPCRMEFPYLQQAYDEYKNDIEILAVNHVDPIINSIRQFAQDNGLSFPVAKVDEAWQKSFGVRYYPTTVVIDRYGMIAMIHEGSVTESGVFSSIFEFFTADDYKQQTVRNISDIIK